MSQKLHRVMKPGSLATGPSGPDGRSSRHRSGGHVVLVKNQYPAREDGADSSGTSRIGSVSSCVKWNPERRSRLALRRSEAAVMLVG